MSTELFGLKHILLIAASMLLVALGFFIFRKLQFESVVSCIFAIGIISETVKVFYYIIANEERYHGILPKNDLPFQLCSIQIILILILKLVKSERVRGLVTSFMMPSCLIGGLAAVIIATDSSRTAWVITLQYFIYHAAIMAFALYLTFNKATRPTVRGYFDCLKVLLVLMFFSIYINSMMYDGVSDFNFMYVVKPPQKGLPYLNDNDGWFSYIIRYAILVLGSVTLFYIKPIAVKLAEKCRGKAKEKVTAEKKTEETV